MKTTTLTKDQEVSLRCRPWPQHGRIREHRLLVDVDGTVRVWDDVGGYYTRCHSLCSNACRRARQAAMAVAS